MIKYTNLKKIIKYYSDFISEEEFNHRLLTSHFAIIPTRKKSPYGIYKISAALDDAFVNSVPVLLPDTYAPHYEFGKNVIRFSWDNLEESIENAIKLAMEKREEYHHLLNEAENLRKKMTPQFFASQFEKFLNNVLLYP